MASLSGLDRRSAISDTRLVNISAEPSRLHVFGVVLADRTTLDTYIQLAVQIPQRSTEVVKCCFVACCLNVNTLSRHLAPDWVWYGDLFEGHLSDLVDSQRTHFLSPMLFAGKPCFSSLNHSPDVRHPSVAIPFPRTTMPLIDEMSRMEWFQIFFWVMRTFLEEEASNSSRGHHSAYIIPKRDEFLFFAMRVTFITFWCYCFELDIVLTRGMIKDFWWNFGSY